MAMSDEMAFLIKDLAVSRVERKGLEKPQGIRHVQDPASPTFWGMKLRDHVLKKKTGTCQQ